MNRTRAVPFAVVALWVGCDALFHIDIDGTSTTTIPAATPFEIILEDLGFGEFVDMDVTENSELQNQGVEPGDISSVEFTTLSLEATGPAGSDLSFIERIELFVEAPGVPRVRVASQDDFPAGQALVELDLDAVDLTEYVVSQSMTITSDVTASRPEEETTVEAYYALDVGVTKQGCNNYLKNDDE
jgi:hypothetical protein